MILINHHIDSLSKLCKTYHVDKMYLFGSAVNSKFDTKSDIDFLAKFKTIELTKYFDNYIDFKENLQSLFKRDVDLVEEQTLRNPILIKSINRSKNLFMGEKILKWLYDIKIAIDEIDSYFLEYPKDFLKSSKSYAKKGG